MLASICEVFGLCFFTVAIVMKATFAADFCILMMNSVFLVPVGWQIWKMRRHLRESWKQFLCFVLACLLELGGVAGLTYKVKYFKLHIQ